MTFERVDAAIKAGDVDDLRRALGDPEGFPNVRGPSGIGGHVLGYAIYHAPVAFVRALLDLGADPDHHDGDGFPPLHAALTSGRRPDELEQLLEALLDAGADIEQRGHNDYTPLLAAVSVGDVRSVRLLLACGADRAARSRIDDREGAVDIAHARAAPGMLEALGD